MLTIRMNFFHEKIEDHQGFRIHSNSSKIVEFDDINSALDFLLEAFGKPSQITVNGRTAELEGSKKETVVATRRRIFDLILDRGYKRKYQSPFTAVPSSRFRAIVKGE